MPGLKNVCTLKKYVYVYTQKMADLLIRIMLYNYENIS